MLVGLCEALDAESLTKDPRRVVKQTIAMWNLFGRTIPNRPGAVLSSPLKVEPDTLPLGRFAASFQEDVHHWADRVRCPNPLDPQAPLRALRPTSIDGYIVVFRRFASALVRRGVLPLPRHSRVISRPGRPSRLFPLQFARLNELGSTACTPAPSSAGDGAAPRPLSISVRRVDFAPFGYEPTTRWGGCAQLYAP